MAEPDDVVEGGASRVSDFYLLDVFILFPFHTTLTPLFSSPFLFLPRCLPTLTPDPTLSCLLLAVRRYETLPRADPTDSLIFPFGTYKVVGNLLSTITSESQTPSP